MKEFDFNQRKQGLEVTTYANSMWVALSRCGIFQKGERTVGLVLPPGAALDKYYGAVMMLLTKADALRYAVPIVRVSSFRQEADVGEALAALSSAKAVIVLISHAAELPLEVTISLDHIVEVGTFKPYHLLSAARAVTELNITMEQAEVLVDFPPSLLFAAIRHSRPIEVTLQKLAASVTKKQASAWEPRVEELAGYGKATEWALDLAEDISAWRHGTISWSDVDAGLLLSGPPGCGKTLFASAVARSCGVGFLAASSAQWQSRGHLGDMLGAMRKTFRQAIADAPVILFLDEFDSFGSRKLLKGNNASYGLQVINALLELLDGANGREGVVVIAATNRPDDIDEALLRPGRLDRHIAVEMPDREAREQILSAHVGLSLPADDLRAIALATGGYSGRHCVSSPGTRAALLGNNDDQCQARTSSRSCLPSSPWGRSSGGLCASMKRATRWLGSLWASAMWKQSSLPARRDITTAVPVTSNGADRSCATDPCRPIGTRLR